MIGFFEHQYLKYKKGHLRNLVALAGSDGHIHDAELELIRRLGIKYGLKPRQVEAIINKRSELAELQLPASHEESMDQLYDLVTMVWADGVVDDEEIAFCEHMVKAMGFKKELVKVMLDKFETGAPLAEEWAEFKSTQMNVFLLKK